MAEVQRLLRHILSPQKVHDLYDEVEVWIKRDRPAVTIQGIEEEGQGWPPGAGDM